MLWKRCSTLLPLLLVACVADDARKFEADSINTDSLPRLGLEEELRIGSVDDAALGFSNIGALAVAGDGRMFSFDLGSMSFRVFSPDGQRLHSFGRRGDGPGEFRSAPQIGIAGDTLWAISPGARRITIYTLDGEHLSTHYYDPRAIPLQPVDRLLGLTGMSALPFTVTGMSVVNQGGGRTSGMLHPRYMVGNGRFLSELREVPARVAAIGVLATDTIRVPRLVFDATGAVVDTAGWQLRAPPEGVRFDVVRVGPQRFVVPAAPVDEPLTHGTAHGHVVVERRVATSSRAGMFAVTRIALNGDTVFRARFRYMPRAYSPELLDRLAAVAANLPGVVPTIASAKVAWPWGIVQLRSRDRARSDARDRIRQAMKFPSFQPPVQEIRVADDGSIWLRREEDNTDSYRWLLLDSVGTPIGEMSLPAAVQVRWSSGDRVHAVERDSVDVPWLVRYRITPAGPEVQ